jgi:hypothetical protein
MRRAAGLVFMIVGVVGLVISLLLLPAIWIGRGYASDQIAAVATGVGAPLDQVDATVAELRGRLESIRGRIREVGEQADAAAQSGTIDQQLAARLVQRLDETVGTEFMRARDAYITLRERVMQAGQLRARLQRLMPWVSIPELPVEDLAAVDRELQALDAAVRDMRTSLTAGVLPGTTLMRQIGEGARQLDARIGTFASLVDRVGERIAQVQTALADAEASLQRWLTIAAIILTLGCLYVAGLHVALIAAGRSWYRRPPTTPAPAPLETQVSVS